MKNTTPPNMHGAPEAFINKFAGKITGIISGLDRVRFRGTLRLLHQTKFMYAYLSRCGVLLKNFKDFAEASTARVRRAAFESAAAAGRPLRHLAGAAQSKEDLARELARADNIRRGLIAIFSAVEPCMSYSLRSRHSSLLGSSAYPVKPNPSL